MYNLPLWFLLPYLYLTRVNGGNALFINPNENSDHNLENTMECSEMLPKFITSCFVESWEERERDPCCHCLRYGGCCLASTPRLVSDWLVAYAWSLICHCLAPTS